MAKLSETRKKELVAQIQEMQKAGKSKNEISAFLMTNEIVYSAVPKFIKDAGLKFRRSSGTTWKDIAAEAFLENKELTKDEMTEAIKDSVQDPEYYTKGYYEVFKKLANG